MRLHDAKHDAKLGRSQRLCRAALKGSRPFTIGWWLIEMWNVGLRVHGQLNPRDASHQPLSHRFGSDGKCWRSLKSQDVNIDDSWVDWHLLLSRVSQAESVTYPSRSTIVWRVLEIHGPQDWVITSRLMILSTLLTYTRGEDFWY